MLFALIFSSSALADPISVPGLPLSTTFQYNWTSPSAVSGSTLFTFSNGVPDTSTPICADLPGCMTGDFSTGNSGTGGFSTDLTTSNCNISGPITSTGAWWWKQYHVPIQCDVTQDLNLLYDTTSAAYSGSAVCGTQSYVIHLDWLLQFINTTGTTYTYSPGLFSGTLSGPGTGTFTEL